MQCFLMGKANIGIQTKSRYFTFFIPRAYNFGWILVREGSFYASKQGDLPVNHPIFPSFKVSERIKKQKKR